MKIFADLFIGILLRSMKTFSKLWILKGRKILYISFVVATVIMVLLQYTTKYQYGLFLTLSVYASWFYSINMIPDCRKTEKEIEKILSEIYPDMEKIEDIRDTIYLDKKEIRNIFRKNKILRKNKELLNKYKSLRAKERRKLKKIDFELNGSKIKFGGKENV